LLKGGTDALLGQAAPSVAAQLLDGKDWDVAKHRGRQVVVLFLHEVSSQIMGRRLLARDLVITGNCLTKTDVSLPSDI
jgi:hypothetical protein